MTPSANTEKSLLRRELKAKRRAIPSCDKKAFDREICEKLVNHPVFLEADCILLYAALPDEISTETVFAKALSLNKTVCFPRCNTENLTMTFHTVTSEKELSLGDYGILAPGKDATAISLEGNRALCIVPALSFDKAGYRIGYGKGYYDRFLTHFHGSTVGVCYSDLLSNDLPRDRYDLAVDCVITEKDILTPSLTL